MYLVYNSIAIFHKAFIPPTKSNARNCPDFSVRTGRPDNAGTEDAKSIYLLLLRVKQDGRSDDLQLLLKNGTFAVTWFVLDNMCVCLTRACTPWSDGLSNSEEIFEIRQVVVE